MKKTICATIEFEPYTEHSVTSALTLGKLKEIVDHLYFTYGGQASFSLQAEENYGSWHVAQEVVTSRLETDDEYAERTLKENTKEEQERAVREAQYLKLKAEFEGSALADIVEKYKDSPPLPEAGFMAANKMDVPE